MTRLAKSTWKNFKTDGRLFEELIQEILPLEFPGHVFQRTPHTHDGARDFECGISLLNGAQARTWIECKYRRERLPAHAVSMTMVMALLDNARQIIFFSYAPVNRAFTQYVGQFHNKTGIDVSIFDDCLLEDLIFKHWNKLDTQKYFNITQPPEAERNPCERVTATIGVSKSGAVLSQGIEPKDSGSPQKTEYFYLNDILEVRFTIRNQTAESGLSIQLHMEQPEGVPFFETLDKNFRRSNSYTIDLPCFAVRQLVLPLKLIRYGSRVTLPTFILQYGQTKKRLKRQSIHCRWIAETPLIGQSYFDIVRQTEEFLFSRANLGWVRIDGASGVGKSRLLKEFSDRAQGGGAQVIFLNAERGQLSFESIIQTLISSLTGLPDNLRGQITLVHDSSAASQSSSYAAKVLYDTDFQFRQEHARLVSLSRKLLESAPTILILDNVQNCDPQTLQFLNDLLDSSSGRPCPSSVILSFNTDLTFMGTAAWSLSQRLSALSAQAPRDFASFTVCGFEENEAMHYLNECLTCPGLEHVELQETFRLILNRCGTQPFFLQNMILYLVQAGVLLRTETTSFYVQSIPSFHRAINSLPKTLEDLLHQREQLLLKHLSIDPQRKARYQALAQLMSAVIRLPEGIYRDLINDYSLLDELISAGILQQGDDGLISFRHQLIQRYYLHQYPLKRTQNPLLEQIIASARRRKLSEPMGQTLFLIQDTIGQIDDDICNITLEQMRRRKLDFSFAKELVPALFLHMEQSLCLPAETVIPIYIYCCQALAGQFGLDAALSNYAIAADYIMSNTQTFLPVYDEAYCMLGEYINSLLNVGKHEEAMHRLDEIQEFLDLVPKTAEGRLEHQIRFALRKCVAYNAMNRFEDGKAAGEEALTLAQSQDNLPLMIQSHMEYGYLYYYCDDACRFQAEMCAHWDAAYQLLQTHYLPQRPRSEWPRDHIIDAVLMTGMLADLSRLRYDNAAYKAELLFDMLDQTHMPFYEAKMRLALSAYCLIQSCRNGPVITQEVKSSITTMLHQAVDRCVVHYLMRDFPACYHLLATAQQLFGQGELAIDNYRKALQLAVDYAHGVQQETQWRYLFLDIAYQLRKRGIQNLGLFDVLQNKALRQECRNIMSLCDKDIQELEIPQLSPLRLPNTSFNIAKV